MGRLARKRFKLTGISSRTMLLDFDYDELERITAVHYPVDDMVIRYRYEGAYLEEVCETPASAADCADAAATSYVDGVTYDVLGRRESTFTPAGSRTFAYDPITQRLELDQFTGTDPGEEEGQDPYTRVLQYGRDGLGNILTVGGAGASSPAVYGATYTYDHRNRLESWTPTGSATFEFGYDVLGNLTRHGVASGGPANQTFAHPTKPHAVTATAAGYAYTYDADGNLATDIGPGGAQRFFGFTSDNRLGCVGTSAVACNIIQVAYAVDGTRSWQYEKATWPNADEEYFYADEYFTLAITHTDPVLETGVFHVYAFGEEIARKRQNPITLRTASPWPAAWPIPAWPAPLVAGLLVALGALGIRLIAVRLAWADATRAQPALAPLSLVLVVVLVVPPMPARGGGGGGTVLRRWLLSDHLGSANVVLAADGLVEAEDLFTPFGGVHQSFGQGVDPRRFAGHRQDRETGLYYMQARWQNPHTGTFLSVDPIVANAADPQSFNAYSYARNNPIANTDPTGTCPIFGSESRCPVFGETATLLQLGISFGSVFDEVFGIGASDSITLAPVSETPFDTISVPDNHNLDSQDEANGVPFFNQGDVDRLEDRRRALEQERDDKLQELRDLSQVARKAAVDSFLDALTALLEKKGADNLINKAQLAAAVILFETRRLISEIATLQRRIDAVKGIIEEKKAARGRRVFPSGE